MQEAEYGLTDVAMQSGKQQARYAGDDQLFVKFFKHPRQDKAESIKEGRPVFKEVDYIEIRQPGNKTSVVCRPVRQMDIDRFPEHWRKYLARITDEHVEGTPLEEWPQITRSQVEELRFFNVRSVEQLANMSDGQSQKFMGINMLKKKAQEFLEQVEQGAIKARDERIAKLEARLASLEGEGAEELEEDEDEELEA